MNNRLLTVIGVIMVLICVGIGILVFRPTPIIESRASALDPQTVVKDHTISVSGEGKYKMKPDVAYVELGVFTQDLNAKKAQDGSKTVMDAVIKAIKAQGLKDEDIQTTRFNIDPQYSYENPKKPTLIGYQVNNMVSLRINNINKVGVILDAASAAGSNQVNSIRFGLKDLDAAYNNALMQAVTNATTKAEVLATSSHIQLKGLIAIQEGGSNSVYPSTNGLQDNMKANKEVTTPILTGEMEISATIMMVFEIKY